MRNLKLQIMYDRIFLFDQNFGSFWNSISPSSHWIEIKEEVSNSDWPQEIRRWTNLARKCHPIVL